MYKLTRKKAAKILGVSTRTVDRYVKSGKIRSKKDGKIVYLNNNDVDNIANEESNQEVIVSKKQEFVTQKEDKKEKIYTQEPETSVEVRSSFTRTALEDIYKDLRNQIEEKDELIRELSLRLGRAEEIAKNSVSLNDYKRSQFLLEESKEHLTQQIQDVKREKETLEKKLRYEKNSNIILIIVVIVLLTVAATIWMLQI